MTERFTAAVLTVSDSSFTGARADAGGPAVAEALAAAGFAVVARDVVPDEAGRIAAAILQLMDVARLVVTTGGTGIAPRDVTPEATRSVCTRLVEGIPELMRAEGLKQTPFAVLTRGVCGVRGTSLVLNLPGNPKGAVASLQSVQHLLPHCLKLIAGETGH